MSEKLSNVEADLTTDIVEDGPDFVESPAADSLELLTFPAPDKDLDELAVVGLAKAAKRTEPEHSDTSIADGTFIEKADSDDSLSINELEEFADEDANERVEYSKENRSFEIFPLPDEIKNRYAFLQDLPKNVAVMGGMARSIAREIITGDREPIRDIDLVNILGTDGESLNDEATLNKLSQQYMADDYAYGHGIQDDSLENYFDTRDFTVNESLIMNGALIVSNFAYNDLQENIIRPTHHERPSSTWRPRSRLALRALLMQTVLSECTNSYPTIEDLEIDGEYISSFESAVALNKAMSRGAETARRFTDLLADYGAIPAELGGKPKAAAKYFRKYRVYNFEFRPSSDSRVANTKSEARIDYYASDPTIRKALEEYDDHSDEKYTRHYSEADFAEINRQQYDDSDEEYDDYDDYYDDWEEE